MSETLPDGVELADPDVAQAALESFGPSYALPEYMITLTCATSASISVPPIALPPRYSDASERSPD